MRPPQNEGFIKFRQVHREAALDPVRLGSAAAALIAWRRILAALNLVGQEPERYEGAGFGNLSARIEERPAPPGRRSFLITGTQTAGWSRIDLDGFTLVERYDYRSNTVWSSGRVRPSSEAMTHGATYDVEPEVRYVFHAHSPEIWRQGARLGLPTTDGTAPYGSPEMALEVHRLWQQGELARQKVLVMAGHEDGVLAFGHTADEAGRALLSALARAFESEIVPPGKILEPATAPVA